LRTLDGQLTKYLTDAHAIEQQALAQMRVAPELAGDAEIAAAFSDHLGETEDHERLVRQLLEARGAAPTAVKDLAGRLTGKGFTAFARSQPDTPGKLAVHAFSYEHMELAAYDFLGRLADRAGDAETAQAARHILHQERAMSERLAGLFDQAVEASLRGLDPAELDDQLDKYLADAHAIEAQAIVLLGKAPEIADAAALSAAFDEHLEQTEEHQHLIDTRLKARALSPSKLKDAVLQLGALNWGIFFQAQPDTPAKLAAFAYAFEHLAIAAYELLTRVARRVEDLETIAVAQRILTEERAAAARLHSLFDEALDASLHALGVGAR
jgi:ferritin-like metal-binding protein YciE